MVPDPMSYSELSRLLRAYDTLTPEQMAAVESAHDSYRERFRALREGDIQRFLDSMQKMRGGMPSKQQADDMIKGMERVNKQIAEVDDSLFEAVVTLAGEDHRTALMRARDARARNRVTSGALASAFAAPVADLSEITLELELTPAERQAVDPTLISYEARLTPGLRDHATASLRMWREVFDELERSGFGNLSQEDMVNDPEKMKAMMEAMQAAMAKAAKHTQAKLADLLALNQSTFQSLSTQLTGKTQRHLRHTFVQKAYAQLGGDPASAERAMLAALRIKKLTAEQRQQVEEAYARWQTADNAIVDKAMKEADEYHSTHSQIDAMTDMGSWQKTTKEVWEKRNGGGAAALKELSNILGDERYQNMAEKAAQNEGKDFFTDTQDPEADSEATPGMTVEASAAEQDFLSPPDFSASGGPMPEAAVTAIADQLALDESRRILLTTMHGDYVKNWSTATEPESKQMREAADHMMHRASEDPESVAQVMKEGRNKQAAAMQALFEKGTQLDSAFFADVESALGADAAAVVAAAKLERMISRTSPYLSRYAGGWNAFGMQAGSVNLVKVLREANLTAEERKAALGALQPRAAALTAKCVEGMMASQQFQRDYQALAEKAAGATRSEEGKTDMAEMQKIGLSMAELQRKLSTVTDQLDADTRAAYKAALDALPEPRREVLQLAYDQAQYPTIFRDKRSALPFLDKALEMKDLTDQQRPQLEALLKSYREEHIKACRAMVPKPMPQPSQTDQASMQQYWQDQMAEANRRETIRFDRDERSQRAVSALRRILTADQAARIPGLSSYEQAAAKKNRYGIEE